MKYSGTLIVVNDMEKSKDFYQNVMEQKILMDLGDHVSLENGLGLQANYQSLVEKDLDIKNCSNNFQLYFEVEDIQAWEKKLSQIEGIEFLHHLKEFPWGQRNIRFYDFDKHIIEVAEDMNSVIKRLFNEGLSIEAISDRTMYPVDYIKNLV